MFLDKFIVVVHPIEVIAFGDNILHVLRRDRNSLFFQWDLMCRDAGIEVDSIPTS